MAHQSWANVLMMVRLLSCCTIDERRHDRGKSALNIPLCKHVRRNDGHSYNIVYNVLCNVLLLIFWSMFGDDIVPHSSECHTSIMLCGHRYLIIDYEVIPVLYTYLV